MKNILIDYGSENTIIGLVENNELLEIIVEDRKQCSIVDNIYVGIVKKILPSQFAFIDIGEEKNAFLNLSDKKENSLYANGKLSLKQGDHIIVQATKDATNIKGAFVTTQISYSSKNLVIVKSNKSSNSENCEILISRKIEDKSIRNKIKCAIQNASAFEDKKGFSIVVRTSAEQVCECNSDELALELETAIQSFEKLLETAQYTKPPKLIYKESNKILKELLRQNISNVVVNDETELESIKQMAENASVVFHTDKTKPLFLEYYVYSQLEKALQKKVWLNSGGFIIIEQAEAAVIIDVNTGKFLGKKTQQATAFKTNCEAAVEIAKQIRLRNLSGMILIDFIDLHDEKDIETLTTLMQEEVKKDRIAVSVVGMTQLGLMQLTRKKTSKPILNYLTKECPCCHGLGRLYYQKDCR